MPKTVDELRVKTNPKIEYTLENHQGPSYSHVQNVGTIGVVEKNRPDTFFTESPDRWFTTPVNEKAPMMHPKQEVYQTARSQQTTSYAGVAGPGNKQGTYHPPTYLPSNKTNLFTTETGPATAMNKGPEAENMANQMKSYKNFSNNRSTTSTVSHIFGSGLTTAIGAVVAPVMDLLSTTRRNDYPSNLRIYGDPGASVPTGYVNNPNDKAPVTIKETTLYTPPLGITAHSQNNQGSYLLNNIQPITNQRSSTDISYFGDAGGGIKTGDMHCSVYSEHSTKEPTMVSRMNHGNAQLFNVSQGNVCNAKTENNNSNQRQWVPTNMPRKSVAKDMIGDTVTPQCYDNTNRNEPNLLDAFRQNPYTHSLASF